MNIWDEPGLAPGADRGSIRRAYEQALAAARDDPSHLPPMTQQRARDLLAARDAQRRLEALRRAVAEGS